MFTPHDDHGTAYTHPSPTDPRLVAVLLRDVSPEPPETYGFQVAILGNYVSPDPVFGADVSAAFAHLGDHELVCRHLRMFHDIAAVDYADYGHHGEATIYVAATTDDPVSMYLREWEAFNEGDVFGVGILRNLDHTASTDEPDPIEPGDGWEWIDGAPTWGYYCSEYAEDTALDLLTSAVDTLSTTHPLLPSAATDTPTHGK